MKLNPDETICFGDYHQLCLDCKLANWCAEYWKLINYLSYQDKGRD